jgi:NACHT conflict system protein
MPEFFTVGFLFKAATTIKTCVAWAREYRSKKQTPENGAITATAADFPSWDVKRALRRVLKTEEFENGMESVRNGSEFPVDNHVANVLIDQGQFSSGLNSTPRDALKVLKSFGRHYREALLLSPTANIVAAQRADQHQRELIAEIHRAGAANVFPDQLFNKAREATAKLTNHWLATVKVGDSEPIALRAIRLDAEGHDAGLMRLHDLRSLIRAGGRIILQAPAGRGKTTTLLQLAQLEDPEQLSLYIDLPAWIDSGKPMLTFLTETSEFQGFGVTAAQLAQLSESVHFIFLLNGWNEIGEDAFRRAAMQIRQLEVSFPTAGMILASRSINVGPALSEAVRVSLSLLNNRERRECIERSGVPRSEELITQIEGLPLLDALTQTPLFLSYVIAIFRAGGVISSTRVGVLSEVVKLLESSVEKQAYLEGDPLRGNAGQYLTSLSVAMTAHGLSRLSIEEARATVSALTTTLRQRGQIQALPEPTLILDALCKYHVLERVDYPIAFRFQHQQFQEFYAAQHLKQELLALVRDDNAASRSRFARQYVNEPIWEEPLLMLAEEIGLMTGAEPDFERAGVSLVEISLGVDPILTAKLSRLCGPAVWKQVGSAVGERLRSIYEIDDENFKLYAAVGMLATGSPDFMDIIGPLLSGASDNTLRGTYRAVKEFHLSSLGENWQNVIHEWDERTRRIFVQELVFSESTANLPSILEYFARHDPSQRVRNAAIDSLIWIGAERELVAVLATVDDAVFEEVLHEKPTEGVPIALRDRYLALTLLLYEAATNIVTRLKLLLRAYELGDQEAARRFKDQLLALPSDQIRDQVNEYTLKPILTIIARTDSQWVSDWVAERFLDRSIERQDLLQFVTNVSQKVKDDLFEIVSTEDLRPTQFSGVIRLASVISDVALAQAMFQRWVILRQAIEGQEHVIPNPERVLANQLEGLFQSLQPEIAIAGLAHCFNEEIDDAQFKAIVTYLNRMKGNKVDLRAELPDDLRRALRSYMHRGIDFIMGQDDVDGHDKGAAALALSTVGEAEDAQDLRRLILADIDRWRAARAARARGEQSELAKRGLMIQAGQHVAALMGLDRESVEPILLEALREPEYEGDAASKLLELATVANTADPFKYPKDYGAIWQARSGHPQRQFDEARRQRYAKAITDVIARLRSNPDEPQAWMILEYRLMELNKALAALDGPSSADLVLEVAALTAKHNGWRTVEALERLLLSGAELPNQPALEILNEIIKSARERSDYDDQARQLLIRGLCVLPFMSDPEVGVERIRQIVAETRLQGYQLRDLVTALGSSQSTEALILLRDFVSTDGEGLGGVTTEWIDAVARLNGSIGEEMLLSLIDPSIKEFAVQMDVSTQGDNLASRLAGLAHANRETMQRILALSSQPLAGARRVLYLKLISQIGTDEAVLAGLEFLDDADGYPVPYDLWKALEEKLFDKRPVREMGGSYNLEPRSANEIRAKLCSLAASGDQRSQPAFKLLGEIEVRRLEDGRPPSELRHPTLDSSLPWPPLQTRK